MRLRIDIGVLSLLAAAGCGAASHASPDAGDDPDAGEVAPQNRWALLSADSPTYADVDHDAAGNAWVVAVFEGVPYLEMSSSCCYETPAPLVAKLSPALEVLWSRRFETDPGDGHAVPLRVQVDPAGLVHIAGTQWGPMRLGENLFDAPAGSASAFLLTLDESGEPVQWRLLTPGSASFGLGLDQSADGKLRLLWAPLPAESGGSVGALVDATDDTTTTCALEPGTRPEIVAEVSGGFVTAGRIDREGTYSAFAAAYDDDCAVRWSHVLEEDGHAPALAADEDGAAFVGSRDAGWTTGTVRRIEASGELGWMTTVEPDGPVHVDDVMVANGVVWAVATTTGSGVAAGASLVSRGSKDVLVMALDAGDGHSLWSAQIGGPGWEQALAVDHDPETDVTWVAANAVGPADLGATPELPSGAEGLVLFRWVGRPD